MKELACAILIVLMICSTSLYSYTPFGEVVCKTPDYDCHLVERGESWATLFPNAEQRDLVKRINRTNVFLRPDMIIAIPKHLDKLSIYDVSPFARFFDATQGEKTIVVDQRQLAWAAYDKEGQLVWWGPISSGSNPCPDGLAGCLTPTGDFRVIKKKGVNCVSNIFPMRLNGIKGGGEMPYCLNFYQGYALHGSNDLPGYPASHGCVRLFIDDAKWLNEQFVETANDTNKGTRVIILNSVQ